MNGSEPETTSRPQRGWLYRLFVPSFDEASLYVMGLAVLLVFFTYPEAQAALAKLLRGGSAWDSVRIFVLFILVVTGILVSLANAFVDREKSRAEKIMILIAGVSITAGTGIAAGAHELARGSGLTMIFPAWNVFNGVVLLFLVRVKVVNEQAVDDRDAKLWAVGLGTAVCVGGWAICRYVAHLGWGVTASSLVFYGTNLNSLVAWLVERRRKVRLSAG